MTNVQSCEIGVWDFIGNWKLGFGILRSRLYKHRNAFTLVETVVSLGILLMGIGASLTLVTASISYSKQTESLIVVTNLAREGLEVVRAIRDVNGFGTLPGGNTAWVLDRTSTTLTTAASFSGGTTVHECTNCDLFINANQYLLTPGSATPYRRLIDINTLNPDEKEVVSTMRWTEHGRVHTYQLTTVLTDWK